MGIANSRLWEYNTNIEREKHQKREATTMTTTLIQRMTKAIKPEAQTALYRTIDGLFSEYGEWVVSTDLKTIENDEYLSGVQYYRNGEEVIAVPTFYLYEGDGSSFVGSRGGRYELNGETLTKED